ncbi:regucalcin isoform X1 [Nilaparvata lugens]|uniref:regucalcin isoform X1 n=2 Tax=Nilaparvata lugens TaxID=108931 RepID=UPI00193CCA61|nr:regucalcin isoform X1 [Nilaparvata lugens]
MDFVTSLLCTRSRMTSYKVSPITCPLHLAKGPHWDANTQTLYCVDIFKGTVHSYKPSTCQFSTATVGDGKSEMAVIVPVTGEKDKFLVSMKNDVATISWDGVSDKTSKPEIVASAEPADNHNRLNNGKVDPCGRLWAGTTGRRLHPTELEFEEDVGSLYCFEKCGKVSKKLDNITISNGLEWSEDCKKFFYVDSYRYNVMAYDYDNATGNICNGKEIFKTKENCVPGLLDAMTIDTAGRLYIANYVGAQVVVIDSHTGKLVQKIPIPAEEVTSCAFGGPNLDILYVTTGNTNPSAKHPIAGRIFQVTGLGATGYAGRSVVL